MPLSLRNLIDRWSSSAIVFGVIYTAACAAVLDFGWGGNRLIELVGAWGNFPLIFALCLVLWPVITDRGLSRFRRRAFLLVFIANLIDVIASIGWGYGALTENAFFGAWPDVLWLFYYPLVAAACWLLYFDVGGRLDTTRALVDFATIAVGFGALIWFTALAPLTNMSASELARNWAAASYGIGNCLCIISGAMVAMQISHWRAERPLMWLLVALVATLVADLVWVNAQLSGGYAVGEPLDLAYHAFYLCLLTSAYTQRQVRRKNADVVGLPGDLRGSLPMVALMVGMVALLNDRLHLENFQSPLLVAVVLGATVLVVTSQAIGTREAVRLHREVSTRRFDERLTELVRRSSDMIAICDPDGVIRYASPSSQQLLGIQPSELAGQRIDEVLGPEAPQVREAFNRVVRADHSEQVANFSIPGGGEEKRSFKMVIANLSHVDSIRGITLNIRDISDATRLHDQLRTLAFHDSLTLLANRSLFADRVHQAITRMADGLTPAVLFIDLDNFKMVNDSLGHGAGDALLRAFAHRLVQCTRAGDTVARLGGDEFAVLIEHATDAEAAMAVARQVLELCKPPVEIEDRELRIAASIGVALADRVSTVERLMRNADAAMYAAKSRGKGHAQLFHPEMLRSARRRIRDENELASVLDKQELEAHYQPVVDLASRHLVGLEALMRWRHPTRGLVMPNQFIPVAEETGQIVTMTQWMIDRACADLARLQRAAPGGSALRMSVNVSSRYLHQGEVVRDVREALGAHGVAPSCLILEVTESLLLEDSSRLERAFRDLKMQGVRLALDDFGTGYSSLSYLHRFPIDIIKIDRSFVQRLVRDSDGSEGVDAVALARAILSLAEALGLDTVAEGIEVDAQCDTLLALGCRTGQGFAFGKPMPIDEVLDAAQTRRRSRIAEPSVVTDAT